MFNPHLHGYSTGVTGGFNSRRLNRRRKRPRYHRRKIDYNFAETGADSDDIVKQAYKLVARMKRDPNVCDA